MPRLYVALILVALAYPFGVLALAREFAEGGAIIIGTFTVGASLLIGLPLALWFIRRGWLKLWQAALAGAVSGLMCTLPFLLGDGLASASQFLIPFGSVGACHGIAFWLLAIFRNKALQHRGAGAPAGKSASAA